MKTKVKPIEEAIFSLMEEHFKQEAIKRKLEKLEKAAQNRNYIPLTPKGGNWI